MMPSLFEIKKQMVDVGKLMYDKGLVIAKHGNISYKISDNEFLCTPGGLCKAFLTPDKLVRVDADGNSLEKDKKPTSEIRMHIAIYRLRPDIRCIVHAQPAATTAFAISDIDATRFVLPGDKEAYFGYVPAAAYDKKNHDANTLAEYMSDPKKQAYVFHGDSSVSVGDTLYNAFDALESLEHYCRISILARSIAAMQGTPAPAPAPVTAPVTAPAAAAGACTGKCETCPERAVCPKCGRAGCDGSCSCGGDHTCHSGSCHTAPTGGEAELESLIRQVVAGLSK